MSASFETTGEVETPVETFEKVAEASASVTGASAPKFVSAADLLKKTRDAEKESRDRLADARKAIIDAILGDEESFSKIQSRMERSAERRYTKLVLLKFKFVPKEGDEVPTHDERGTQVVYEMDGRKYYLYSIIKKGGDRFFPELAARFGSGYWCDSYYNREEQTTNIFVSWGPRQTAPAGPRPSTGDHQGRPAQGKAHGQDKTPAEKKAYPRPNQEKKAYPRPNQEKKE